MDKKQLKKYNIVNNIYFELFGRSNNYRIENICGGCFDVSFCQDQEIDITKTSFNLDFVVKTFQSRGENIYFNIILFDYETKIEYFAGCFYIKDNRGMINNNHLQALSYIIESGNQKTAEIYKLRG